MPSSKGISPAPDSGRPETLRLGEREVLIRMLARDEHVRILPMLRVLNPHFTDELMLARLTEMSEQGYECAAAFHNDEIVGCCGIWIFTKVYCGRFIEPDNVCVHPEWRSSGLGAKLIDWVMRYGEANGCDVAELNAYVHNGSGHKFWMNQGFKILGFHFQREFAKR